MRHVHNTQSKPPSTGGLTLTELMLQNEFTETAALLKNVTGNLTKDLTMTVWKSTASKANSGRMNGRMNCSTLIGARGYLQQARTSSTHFLPGNGRRAILSWLREDLEARMYA
jgi:hypothetical protein